MNTPKYIITSLLLSFFSYTTFGQCYELEITAGFYGDAILTENQSTDVTYEICNNGDPIPLDPNGPIYVSICPSINNMVFTSTFIGSGLSYFSLTEDMNCTIAEQFTTIPSGCFEFVATVMPTIIDMGDIHCIQTNIVSSGILTGSSCNVIDNDMHDLCINSILMGIVDVELVSFQVIQDGNKSLLSWTTASEVNNDYFNIERSKDGTHFESIGKVDGSGTSNDFNHYSFVDQRPEPGTNFYRLQQFDFNGDNTYSEIRALNFEAKERRIQILPNPAVEFIQIQGIEESSKLQLIDLTGKEIMNLIISNEQKISIADFQSGTYLFNILNAEGETIHSEKVIVSK